jgi:hypothetical protein
MIHCGVSSVSKMTSFCGPASRRPLRFPVVGHFAALLFQHLVDQLLAAVDPEIEQALAFLVGVQDQFAEVLARRHVDDVVVAAAADLDGPQLRFQRFQLLADVDGDAAGAHDLPLGVEDRGVAAQVLPAKTRTGPT